MRNKTLVLGAVALLAGSVWTAGATADEYTDLDAWKAAVAEWTLINFDTDPAGDPLFDGPIGEIYADYGVSFPPGNDISSTFWGPVSPPNGWINNTLVDDGRQFDFEVTVGDIYAAGAHNVGAGGTPNGSRLDAYNDDGDLLESVLSDGISDTLDFFGVTTTEPIAYVTITAIDPAGWGLDDLYVGVPEPAGLALLGLGTMLAGVRRR